MRILFLSFIISIALTSCNSSKKINQSSTINKEVQEKITVSNATEFIKAIGSNREIYLNPGVYNLTEAMGTSNSFVTWNEYLKSPYIVNVENLKLTGKDAEIVIEDRYAWVLIFIKSKNIKIEGLTLGHTEGGYCQGGVVSFEECENAYINNSNLYGCGTEGIAALKTNNLTVTNTRIYKCTYDLLSLIESNNISFDNCIFEDTKEYDLITIDNCSNVSFTNSIFRRNVNSDFMPYFFNINKSSDILVKKCEFNNNEVVKFCNDNSLIQLKGNTFTKNLFETP